MSKKIFFGLIFSNVFSMTIAHAAPLSPLADVESCMRKNAISQSLRQTLEITQIENKSQAAYQAEWMTKADKDGRKKAIWRFSAPANMSGTAYLVFAPQKTGDKPVLYAYLPSFQKVKRIEAQNLSGTIGGVNISYQEIQMLQGIWGSGKLERLDDNQLAGRKIYVLRYTPPAEQKAAPIVLEIDQQSCVPLQTTQTDTKTTRRITTPASSLAQDKAGRWYAKNWTIIDTARKSEARLTLKKHEPDAKLNDNWFSPQKFYEQR